MVVVLTGMNGRGHIDGFVKTYDRSYGHWLHEMTYHDLFVRGSAPAGVYIFGDRWRMNAAQLALATNLWDQLAQGKEAMRLVNDPRRELDRFAFMRRLGEAGLNDFQVHRLGQRAVRYPVFLRMDNDHLGPRTDLLHEWDQVEREAAKLVLGGEDPNRIMVTEYIETAGRQGLYKKYGAMRIGDTILAHHVMLSLCWTSKRNTRIRTDSARDESDQYTLSNPHAEQLMPIFELAGIEYGRIDYGLLDGKVQTWEINDNPIFMHMTSVNQMSRVVKHPAITRAFRALEEGLVPGPHVELAFPEAKWSTS